MEMQRRSSDLLLVTRDLAAVSVDLALPPARARLLQGENNRARIRAGDTQAVPGCGRAAVLESRATRARRRQRRSHRRHPSGAGARRRRCRRLHRRCRSRPLVAPLPLLPLRLAVLVVLIAALAVGLRILAVRVRVLHAGRGGRGGRGRCGGRRRRRGDDLVGAAGGQHVPPRKGRRVELRREVPQLAAAAPGAHA